MNFVEKLKNGKISVYPVDNKYRIYGETFEIKEELKKLGAVWNKETKIFELDFDSYEKLDPDLKELIFKMILKLKMESVKVISEAILNGSIKLYPKYDEYKVYGKTKEIRKELLNCGFKPKDKHYQLKIELFNKEFGDDVKEIVEGYSRESEEMEG